jgi:hypothetical protein
VGQLCMCFCEPCAGRNGGSNGSSGGGSSDTVTVRLFGCQGDSSRSALHLYRLCQAVSAGVLLLYVQLCLYLCSPLASVG